MYFKSLVDLARTRIGHRRSRGFFDEPSRDIEAGITCFRGWVAARQPIESIALEIDGRADVVNSWLPRADVLAAITLPNAFGFEHYLFIPASARGPRRYSGRILVNGALAFSQVFTCTGEPPSPKYKPAADLSRTTPRDLFHQAVARMGPDATILEAGTRQAVVGRSTNWRQRFPSVARKNYVMMDVEDGEDVDVVADLHCLPASMTSRFDAFIANAVFEHLARPWIAAKEIARVLKPGGLCYIDTHQTFPLHGYPSDFFRFSVEALSLVMRDAGLEVIDVAYENRARILAPTTLVPGPFATQWNDIWPSYIGVHILAEKPRERDDGKPGA
jgi:SAM-dependent methyltransferase